MAMFKFTEIRKDQKSQARTGIIETDRGEIKTPVFMPVGTIGSVKSLSSEEIYNLGADIILGNAYHLYLRPGLEVLKEFGGLHNFMNWEKSILTDSGGFQVFSLANMRKITDEGVEFASHIDGSSHFFTPEKVMEIQKIIGSDIAMVLDECVDPEAPREYVLKSLKRTHDWAKRSKDFPKLEGQAVFGIVQGSVFKDLRIESAKFIKDLNFEGVAVGGLAVGESREKRLEVLDILSEELPKNKPHYLMGVGEPVDILETVERGIDMFDCVMPTRMARNGAVWTITGRINLRNAKYTKDKTPIEVGCGCLSCKAGYSKGYLSHLIKNNEILGHRLTTLHNLHFLLSLMENIRESINNGSFPTFKKDFILKFNDKIDTG